MNMITATVLTIASGCAIFSASHPAYAADPAPQTNTALSNLAGSAIPSTQLGELRGGTFVIASTNIGIDSGNSANNSPTGTIINNNSINGTGITTVLQNTGNNTLMQSSTTINIAIQ
ncbi:MAG TPA: hypothetical protein PLD79_05935 [Halothiobacillus sp.]|nr:hypothetical protein [Halothiobacillus sp.]